MASKHAWYQTAIFYEVHIRAYMDGNGDGHGDLAGLTQKLDYIKDLGVDCIWILPHYPSPLKDDGYDISDYYGIHPDYGNLDDFKALVEAVHARGLKIVVDLVMNHTSDRHEWFRQSRSSRDSPYRDYYVWSDTDERYQEARIIFLDTEPSNWSWDEGSGQYYWHRFYASQPDLNYDNPAVEAEMFRVAEFWLELGVDGFRADAVPYLYEREGTNCENLPETHAFLQRLRKFMDERYPGRIILSEANQWPEDVRPYFADGNEVHMNFHFPLMPRVFMALKSGDIRPVVEILERTPEIPENCQWCTFLRNHDELTLEMVIPEEREWMWAEYAPEPRMRLNLGIRRRLAPLLDNDKRKILLAFSLLMTLPGTPVLYYGDEIGMGDNIWLRDRDGVRTPMQWDSTPHAGFSAGPAESLYAPVIDDPVYGYRRVNVADQIDDPDSTFSLVRQMIARRKSVTALGKGSFEWAANTGNPALAAFWRSLGDQKVLVVHNLIGQVQSASISIPEGVSGRLVEIFTAKEYPRLQDNMLQLTLAPYQYHWLESR
ncbi:MAG: maltose alpha-D-glucosyltransferase [Anaerolineales bacterium]|nr:maltose alpha-D-glucosyltransferase [Anaerolineales bacterium]